DAGSVSAVFSVVSCDPERSWESLSDSESSESSGDWLGAGTVACTGASKERVSSLTVSRSRVCTDILPPRSRAGVGLLPRRSTCSTSEPVVPARRDQLCWTPGTTSQHGNSFPTGPDVGSVTWHQWY